MSALLKLSPVVVIVAALIWRLYTWDFFETLTPFSTLKNCIRIDDIPNLTAEDVKIDRRNGIAYFSVTDFSTLTQPIPFQKDGFITKYDIKSRKHKVMKVVAAQNFSFHPHGISLFRDPKSDKLYLFAVSHSNEKKDSVEIFVVDEVNDQLIHQRTIHSSLFVSLNAVVAVSPSEFYATNFVRSQMDSIWLAIELVTNRPWSSIVQCDLSECKIAADNLFSANGIAMSHDGSTLFLGHTMSKQFSVFHRNNTDNKLTLLETRSIPHTADNLDVDEFNQIWFAGSSVKGSIESTKHQPGNIPSKISVASYPPLEFKEVLVDDGSLIRISTTAVQWNGNVLISSFVSPFAVHCQL